MYSLGGPDLANFASKTNEKKFQMCQTHLHPKEYFFYPTRMTLCGECLIEKSINQNDCTDARKFCQAMMHRFTTLLDNATHMPNEHIQKEKEYGIPWRSAFKKQIFAHADQIYKKLVDPNGQFPEDEDPFTFYQQMIQKEALEANSFASLSQADFIVMMVRNLETFENSLYQVKAMLREENFKLFDQVQQETLQRLKIQQVKMNPTDVDVARNNM